jgi:hypothetical protein
LFVDLALSPGEQLDQVLDALARWSSPPALLPFPQLQALVARRKAA